jgi:hypothetical protein
MFRGFFWVQAESPFHAWSFGVSIGNAQHKRNEPVGACFPILKKLPVFGHLPKMEIFLK